MFPIIYTIGPFNVYAFGFFLALSFFLATFIIWKYGKEELMEEEYLDAFFYTSLVSLVTARLVYIVLHLDDFGLNILRYIVVRETPGLSLLGGLLGGFLYLLWYSKKKKYNFLHLLDLFSLSVSLILFLVKIGEGLGGAGFGRETQLNWGIKIVGLSGKRHPVEFYEAICFFFLFLLTFILYKKTQKNRWPAGLTFLLFTQVMCLSVFLLEFLKDYSVYLYGMSFRQIIVFIIILAAFYPLIKRIRIIKKMKEAK